MGVLQCTLSLGGPLPAAILPLDSDAVQLSTRPIRFTGIYPRTIMQPKLHFMSKLPPYTTNTLPPNTLTTSYLHPSSSAAQALF